VVLCKLGKRKKKKSSQKKKKINKKTRKKKTRKKEKHCYAMRKESGAGPKKSKIFNPAPTRPGTKTKNQGRDLRIRTKKTDDGKRSRFFVGIIPWNI
jgi:hypothetical protein